MVKKNVGRDKIKAIWQLSRNALEVVFLDEQRTKKRLETLQHDVNGKNSSLAKKIRILHVPTCIPNEFLSAKLGEAGVLVKYIRHDIDRVDGVMSNVRMGFIECKNVG